MRNAEGLLSILSGFFGAPFRLEEFVGCWLELEPGDRWQLGAPGGLGQTTAIGTRVWSRNSKFRLIVGPVGLEEYERLLPGGPSLARLAAIVRNYVGDTVDWDVNVILRARRGAKRRIRSHHPTGSDQLGWCKENPDDAADLFLQPNDFNTEAA